MPIFNGRKSYCPKISSIASITHGKVAYNINFRPANELLAADVIINRPNYVMLG